MSATDAETAGVEIKASDLALILEGIELASVKRRKRWRPQLAPL